MRTAAPGVAATRRLSAEENSLPSVFNKISTNEKQSTMTKPKILILCTGNSCRSHMAEGILRQAARDRFEVFSAGSKPAGYVHPLAIQALQELGIDISDHESKHLDEFLNAGIHTVITVCGNANDACPVFPGKVVRHHYGFEDPPKAARHGESEIDAFRRIRDQIKLVFEAYADGYCDAMERH